MVATDKSPWPPEVCEETTTSIARRERKSLPPRLPSEARANISKAGLRTSQDRSYSPDFPEPVAPVSSWLSYLLTAAGQFRDFTGFPFHSPCGETVERPPYIGSTHNATLSIVENSPCRGWHPTGKIPWKQVQVPDGNRLVRVQCGEFLGRDNRSERARATTNSFFGCSVSGLSRFSTGHRLYPRHPGPGPLDSLSDKFQFQYARSPIESYLLMFNRRLVTDPGTFVPAKSTSVTGSG
jgi:hypothetical protein